MIQIYLLFYWITSMLMAGSCFSDVPSSYPTLGSYGTWDSPVSAEKIAEGSVYTSNMLIDDNFTYFCEMRPSNHGRYTIVRRNADGTVQDMTPPEFDVRTFVHEYGGGAFTVNSGVIYASNGDDHAIYKIQPNEAPCRLTEGQIVQEGQIRGTRFADLHMTSHGLIAIGEQHGPDQSVQNFIALINVDNGSWKKIAEGYDFYSSPAISPDGTKIAWICWNHPNMPWTNTELWTAEFDENGQLFNLQQIGGNIVESFFQPQWSPNNILYFVTDRNSGWWNIHCYENGQIENVCPIEAEVAEPLWTFGLSTYTFIGENIVFTYNHEGIWDLAFLDIKTKKLQRKERKSSYIYQVRCGVGYVQFLEQYSDQPETLIQIDENGTIKQFELFSPGLRKEYISLPRHISFPSKDHIAHAFYYPPNNPYYKAPVDEKPPLIVMIHGGPTWQTTSSFQLEKQFWTTRGFAILDVNYGGSTGYGRDYRSLLDGSWGIVDIEDCVNGALFLAQQGIVDVNKMAIRGKSSGGYTTLAALAFRDVFKAGASYYGIADLTTLAQDTHKFEQRYLDQLIGKYSEKKAVWEERSPIHSISKIRSPIILFQGEEDTIVPKNQSIMIYELLKQVATPVDLYIYSGEGHGFRQSKNIVHSLNCELEFYIKTFGLRL